MKLTNGQRLAIEAALKGQKRQFMIGAVAQTPTGGWARAYNGIARTITHAAHAEIRLIKHLVPNCEVYVARVTRGGKIKIAKPCRACEFRLKMARVARIIYSTDDGWDMIKL